MADSPLDKHESGNDCSEIAGAVIVGIITGNDDSIKSSIGGGAVFGKGGAGGSTSSSLSSQSAFVLQVDSERTVGNVAKSRSSLGGDKSDMS